MTETSPQHSGYREENNAASFPFRKRIIPSRVVREQHTISGAGIGTTVISESFERRFAEMENWVVQRAICLRPMLRHEAKDFLLRKYGCSKLKQIMRGGFPAGK
jgi:hypothetical protein